MEQFVLDGRLEALDVGEVIFYRARADVSVTGNGPVKGRFLLTVRCVCNSGRLQALEKKLIISNYFLAVLINEIHHSYTSIQ